MHSPWIVLSVATLLAALVAPAGAAPITLVQAGQPAATIVIARHPTQAAQLAADELQWHLRKITGATVPIVADDATVTGLRLLVGPSAATAALGVKDDLHSQEYLIRFLPQAIVLVGKDRADYTKVVYGADHPDAYTTWPDPLEDCSTLYAVYDFLERYCGVRWYNPTELGLVLPHRRTLTVTPGPDTRRAPAFVTRINFPYNVSPNPPGWSSMAENMDYDAMLWQRNTPQAQEIERLSWPTLHQRWSGMDYLEAKRSACLLYVYRARLGGEKWFANHSLYGYWPRFYKKVPGEESLFEEPRPQYFAQGYGASPPSQLCYTNPDLVAQVTADARAYFDHGTMKYGAQDWGNFFTVVPNDDSNWCKCPTCQAQIHPDAIRDHMDATASDYWFGFVNKIAKNLEQTNPGKYVSTLAYASYEGHPDFSLEPNVSVALCLATRNWWAPACKQADMRMLQEWNVEKNKRPMFCWVYWCFPVEIANNGRFNAFPGAFAHTAAEQYRILLAHGIRGMFYCGVGQDVENYVAQKLMDNPNLKVDDILNDFFTGQYGAAGRPLLKFYDEVEAVYSNPQNYPPQIASGKVQAHQSQEIAWKWLGTGARMARWATLIDQARACRLTAVQRERLDIFIKGYWDYMVAGRRQYEEKMALPIPHTTVPRIAAAGGDAARVDWTQAVVLDHFYQHGTQLPSARKLVARLAHDGQYLYLQLEDPCDVKKLNVSPGISCYDDWELFMAAQRALPYRQVLVGPTGMIMGLTDGEVNWRMDCPWPDTGIKVVSDTTRPDRWVLRLAIPLTSLAPHGGVQPGGKFYLGIIRVTGPQITGGPFSVDCSLSEANVHEPDRLGEFTLAP